MKQIKPVTDELYRSQTLKSWDSHYEKDKAKQQYPDENLVRILKGIEAGPALDFGCGSGRHLKLLSELGFSPVSGVETSESAYKLCSQLYPGINIIQLDGEKLENTDFILPVQDESQNAVVLWGVLHYNTHSVQQKILKEVRRILKPGGTLAGTLRSVSDSHFQGNKDLEGVPVGFYTSQETRNILGPFFDEINLGYTERSPIGDLNRKVAHWIFQAFKL